MVEKEAADGKETADAVLENPMHDEHWVAGAALAASESATGAPAEAAAGPAFAVRSASSSAASSRARLPANSAITSAPRALSSGTSIERVRVSPVLVR